ncbi:odorant receptor 264 [Nasonia vitripennis]|uniref:Odorant receptor n=1 Tax=Nasonia vitripennis TaxID=7425 RepID=A0A7M6UGY8_NASVI|nr:odorant receptor 264 [Nasonia vitripennis]
MKTKDESLQPNIFLQHYLNINSKMLRYMGLVVRTKGNKTDSKSKILERLPTYATNLISIIDAFFQMRWIMDLWQRDNDLVMQITTSGISNIVCICKGFRLAYCREDIQTLFEKLATIWDQTCVPEDIRDTIVKKAQSTLVFCRCYIVMMLGLGICFALPPMKNFLIQYFARKEMNHTYDYSERVFLVRYPFEINSSSIYFSVLFEEQWVLFCSALYWVCCDTLFAQLTTHTSLHFEILQYDIEAVVNRENDEDRLKQSMIDFVKRHRELLRICHMIEKLFSPVIFTTMLLTSINICVNVFELREMISEAKLGDALLHGFHLVNIFFQLLVYCIFAERLTQQAGTIANATYNCKWTEKNNKLRIYLQILIMKSQKPFHCTAYGFFPIDHKTITIIVNRALSFYMMLETTN